MRKLGEISKSQANALVILKEEEKKRALALAEIRDAISAVVASYAMAYDVGENPNIVVSSGNDGTIGLYVREEGEISQEA